MQEEISIKAHTIRHIDLFRTQILPKGKEGMRTARMEMAMEHRDSITTLLTLPEASIRASRGSK
jgi:hypothetical protein